MDTSTVAFAFVVTLTVFLTGYNCNTVPMRIPDDDCLVSIENFTSKVVDRRWISVYDSRGYEETLNMSLAKINVIYKYFEDGIVHYNAVYWRGECKIAVGNATIIHEDKAVWQILPGDTFYTEHRVNRMMSSDLDKYLILFMCLTEPDTDRNCHQSKIIVFIPDFHGSDEEMDNDHEDMRQVINHVPFTQINKKLAECMNLTLEQTEIDGSHIMFDWIGQNCIHLLAG